MIAMLQSALADGLKWLGWRLIRLAGKLGG